MPILLENCADHPNTMVKPVTSPIIGIKTLNKSWIYQEQFHKLSPSTNFSMSRIPCSRPISGAHPGRVSPPVHGVMTSRHRYGRPLHSIGMLLPVTLQ